MKNTSIKFRLFTLIAIFLSFFVVSFILSMISLNKIMDDSESIYKVRLIGIQNLVEADRDAYQSNLAFTKLLNNKAASETQKNGFYEEVVNNLNQINERFSVFKNAFNASRSQQYPELENIFKKDYNKLTLITNQILLEVEKNNYAMASQNYSTKYTPVFESVRNVMDQFTNFSSIDAENEYNHILSTQKSSIFFLLIIFCLLVICGIAAGIFLIRSITVPLNNGINFAQEIAKGNLTAIIPNAGDNELGKLNMALKSMSEKLKEIVSSIVSSASNIASASQQLSSTSQQISSGVNGQAASAEEVSSSMEQMTSNIQQNTANAQSTQNLSTKSSNSMQQVALASEDSMNAVSNIYSKINVVVEIAEKTDLLAINAAVEAARAGDQGRGFAVVAAEVRKLAERSQTAANEIVTLAEKGMKMTTESTNMLKSIVPDFEQTSQLVEEIATSSKEQAVGADQINSAIQQLSMVTQQNAASSEEMAGSSEELAAQAEELEEVVTYFSIEKKDNGQFFGANIKSATFQKTAQPKHPGKTSPVKTTAQPKIDLSAFNSDLEKYH